MSVFVEIADCTSGRIDVKFDYDKRLVEAMRTIAGRSYVKVPSKHWHVPLDMEACRQLRTAFGDQLVIGEKLRAWAFAASRQEATLGSLALSSSAELQRLPTALPSLYEAVHLGPLGRFMTPEERAKALTEEPSYQSADAAFVATSPAPLVGNEQGTGKTITYIAGVWEAGLEEGNHLVICPRTAVDGTWDGELRNWQKGAPKDVAVFACTDDRGSREATLKAFSESTAPVKWVVVNPAMIRYVKDPTRTAKKIIATKSGKASLTACYCKASKGPHEHYVATYPAVMDTEWTTICFDEAHKGGVRNRQSLTAKSAEDLKLAKGGKRTVLTGTPMKKKGGSDLWGILHWLRPDVFTSFWRFAESYFKIEDNGYGKKVGELRPEKEEDMWRMLQPYMLRRLKSEVAPWLPPKLYVPVPVFLPPKQLKQYAEMEESGANELATTDNVLALFTRLKQFANAYCKMEGGEIVPVESAKVDAMLEKMDEAGMFDEGATRKQLVFSQSKRMVKFIAQRLRDEGLKVDVISGDNNKSAERKRIMDEFQNGDTRVLVIVTTAGGVSLTLDAADEVHLIDEMWSPDEDVQAEDRAHRVSRIHQVTVFIYQAIGTIDMDISEAKTDKAVTHEQILDVRRKVMARHART